MATGPEGAAILSVTVRYRGKDGREGEIAIDPRTHDAVFWDDAVDQFLLPFYLTTYGFERMAKIRSEIQGEVRAAGITIPRHKKLCSLVLGLKQELILEP
jgi:hypothetical protein